MERIWHGRGLVKPFLALGGTRNILVPREGRNVPFTIENVPYADRFGRETVTFVRTFDLPGRSRRFDAQMVLSPKGDRVLDYLGTHQHLASDLYFGAEADGSLLIRSGEHRFGRGPSTSGSRNSSAARRMCGSGSTSGRGVSGSGCGW